MYSIAIQSYPNSTRIYEYLAELKNLDKILKREREYSAANTIDGTDNAYIKQKPINQVLTNKPNNKQVMGRN